jgi:hypothetical protein
MKDILRNALGRLTVQFVLLQLGLILIVSLLFAAWLHIPDSGVIVVIATALLAALILMLAFCGEASLLRRLAGSERGHMLSGAITLLIAAALWLVLSAWLNHFDESGFITRMAGYANSRFPHSLRNIFTFENLLRWLGWMGLALKWLGAGMLVGIAVPFAQTSRPVRAGLRVLFSLSYWVTLALTAIIVTVITQSLIEWTPGHGLRVEATSLVLRLGTVAIIDAAFGCFVLAVVTEVVVRLELRHAIPVGTPELSHPRSVDIP